VHKKLLLFQYIISLIVFVFIIQSNAFSATLFLKNGREINAQHISDIGKKYRCHIKQGITLDIAKENVARVEAGESRRKELRKSVSVSLFTYDLWVSGVDIDQALAIARENDLPLIRKGYCTSSKHYDPKNIEPYAKTYRSFCYRSNLLGRNCSVELYFTPKSRLLYHVIINWGSPQKLKDFLTELEYVLNSKYGNNSSLGFGIMHKTRTWLRGKNVKIVLDYLIGSAALHYIDNQMTLLKDQEKQKIYDRKKKAYLYKDRQKF